jgi:hypothetical protein
MWRRREIRFVLVSHLSEGLVATLRVVTPIGDLLVMGEPQQELSGRRLIVSFVHTGGDIGTALAANTVGLANLQVVAQAFLEVFDYDQLVLEGAVRTSGRRRGARPRPIRFTRHPEPADQS